MCPSDPKNPAWKLDELARAMQEEERKPNPVVQRVKIIMAMGLTVVHLHSRFLSGMTGLSLGLGSPPEEDRALAGEVGGREGEDEIEKVPLTEYLWWKTFNLSIDQVSVRWVSGALELVGSVRRLFSSQHKSLIPFLSITLQLVTIVLATILFVKYIFFDKSETYATSATPSPAHSRANSQSSARQPALSCPFDISDISEFSLVRRRRGSVCSVGNPEHGIGWRNIETEQLRRLLEQETTGVCANGGTPHQSYAAAGQDSPANTHRLVLSALPALPNTVSETGSDSSSSSSSLEDFPSATERLPTLDQPLTLPPRFSSTGTQTGEDGTMFMVGDSPTPPSEMEVEPAPRHEEPPQAPPPPRPLEECLTLFKSEVSEGGAMCYELAG